MSRSEVPGSRKLIIAAYKGRKNPAFTFSGVLMELRRDTIIKEVCELSAALRCSVFLVGGMLRNFALSMPFSNDYDFAVSGGAEVSAGLAHGLAVRLGGSAFPIDVKRGVYRVVTKRRFRGKAPFIIDIAPFKGRTLRRDLNARDFTVNALAVNLRGLFSEKPDLTDLCGGVKDARQRILRAVTKKAFEDDPLRMLRAVRFSQQYGLKIERETRAAIKEKSAMLSGVSAERIREELLMIFGLPGSARAIGRIYALGMARAIFPEFAEWKSVQGYGLLAHSLKTLDEAERIAGGLSDKAFHGLRARLEKHFGFAVAEVKRAALFKMSAFFHDAGKATTITRSGGALRFIGHDSEGGAVIGNALKRLRFSTKAARAITGLALNHHRVFNFALLNKPSAKAMERLVAAGEQHCKGGAVDMLLLALADARATRGAEDKRLLAKVKGALKFYYGACGQKPPEPLLDGREVMKAFHIGEGRRVGEIMSIIERGVEAGGIKNKKDAIAFVKKMLSNA